MSLGAKDCGDFPSGRDEQLDGSAGTWFSLAGGHLPSTTLLPTLPWPRMLMVGIFKPQPCSDCFVQSTNEGELKPWGGCGRVQ